jgi:toxin-antitoxin system PIN domain toxin
MILADVNVLVNAFRVDAPDHRRCRTWLEGIVAGESRYGMSPQVLGGFLRVVTHPKVFAKPSRIAEALPFAEALLADPNCVSVYPGESHWRIFTRLCREADARGNLVPDAWFAALAIEAGCDWITLDRDYARFPGLKWRAPNPA